MVKRIMVKRKYKRKTWWQKHYDEVILIGFLLTALYFFLKGMGTI